MHFKIIHQRTETTHQQRAGNSESRGLSYVLLASGVNVYRLRSYWRRTFWAHAVIKVMWC